MIPYLNIAIYAAAAAFVFAGGWKLRDMSADAQIARMEKSHAEKETALALAAQQAHAAEREAAARGIQLAEQASAEGRAREQVALDRAAALSDAAARLRRQLANAPAVAACHQASPVAPAPERSASVAGPGLVSAELYRSVDEEAIELAVAFDRSFDRGFRCEQFYDAVRKQMNEGQ